MINQFVLRFAGRFGPRPSGLKTCAGLVREGTGIGRGMRAQRWPESRMQITRIIRTIDRSRRNACFPFVVQPTRSHCQRTIVIIATVVS